MELTRLMKRGQSILTQDGFKSVAKHGKEKLSVYLEYPIKKMTYSREQFAFNGRKLRYAVHPYCETWRNERCIEVPIMLDFLEAHQGQNILEIGHVSNYFGKFKHLVVDKYETTDNENVLNIDILEFKPKQQFDAVLSISTFEHIGWDEAIQDSAKIIEALDAIKSMLKYPSRALISFPIGYNPFLDQHIKEDRIGMEKLIYMKRVSEENHWEETNQEEAFKNLYGSKYPGANAMLFGLGFKS